MRGMRGCGGYFPLIQMARPIRTDEEHPPDPPDPPADSLPPIRNRRPFGTTGNIPRTPASPAARSPAELYDPTGDAIAIELFAPQDLLAERPTLHFAERVADRLCLGLSAPAEGGERIVEISGRLGMLDGLGECARGSLELLTPGGEQRAQPIEVLIGAIAEPLHAPEWVRRSTRPLLRGTPNYGIRSGLNDGD